MAHPQQSNISVEPDRRDVMRIAGAAMAAGTRVVGAVPALWSNQSHFTETACC
jgi:hypothetical protein